MSQTKIGYVCFKDGTREAIIKANGDYSEPNGFAVWTKDNMYVAVKQTRMIDPEPPCLYIDYYKYFKVTELPESYRSVFIDTIDHIEFIAHGVQEY